MSARSGRTWSCKGAPRFRSIEEIGHGGLGVVHRVHDDDTGQELALKTLPRPDPERAYHIKEEFRALAGMAHPNLVELYELVVEGDQCFFTMELLDGVPFTEYVWAAVASAFRPSPAAGLVAAGLAGYHLQRDCRYPGTHPLAPKQTPAAPYRAATRAVRLLTPMVRQVRAGEAPTRLGRCPCALVDCCTSYWTRLAGGLPPPDPRHLGRRVVPKSAPLAAETMSGSAGTPQP